MPRLQHADPPPPTPLPVEHLTAWHACDLCGVRAFEVWRHPRTWALLTFCMHDGRALQLHLSARGFELYMTAKAYA